MLVTVRRPGVRMAPVSSISACRQLRWKKSGAKQRITAAKRGGSRSMVAVLWRGRPSLAAHPLQRLRPGNGQTRAKGQIALKCNPDGAWHSDRTHFQALSDWGHVLALGESMSPHIGGTFAVWQITPQGRAIIGEPL